MKLSLPMLLCLPLLVSLGCHTLDRIDPTSKGDVADRREEREEQLLAEFEQSRSEAQFLAAMTSWEHGDPASARQSMEQIVTRDPSHAKARLLLADLLAAEGKNREAENHLRLLLAQDAANAQAHFALGLLLESDARTAEAMNHFQQAVALEPQNDLYALTASSVAEEIGPAASDPAAQPASYAAPTGR